MPTKRKRVPRTRISEPDNFELIFEHNIWPEGVLEVMLQRSEEQRQKDLAWHKKLMDGTWKDEVAKVTGKSGPEMESD